MLKYSLLFFLFFVQLNLGQKLKDSKTSFDSVLAIPRTINRSKLLDDLKLVHNVIPDRIKAQYSSDLMCLAISDAAIQKIKLKAMGIMAIDKKNLVATSTIFLFLLFVRQRIKRRKEKLHQFSIMENKIHQLSRELDRFSNGLIEKNDSIRKLELRLKEIEAYNKEDPETVKAIGDLYDMKILTEDDWNEYKNLFNRVNKGALASIRKKHPDLTQSEERLILLLKMKFRTSEIAKILGISADSVRKGRKRLRDKLNLTKEMILEKVVQEM